VFKNFFNGEPIEEEEAEGGGKYMEARVASREVVPPLIAVDAW